MESRKARCRRAKTGGPQATSAHPITVRWHTTTSDETEQRQAALNIVETVLSLPQRKLDAPVALHTGTWLTPADEAATAAQGSAGKEQAGAESAEAGRDRSGGELGPARSGPTTQAAQPISYEEAAKRFAILGWDVDLKDPEAFIGRLGDDPAIAEACKPSPYAPEPRARTKRNSHAGASGTGTVTPMNEDAAEDQPGNGVGEPIPAEDAVGGQISAEQASEPLGPTRRARMARNVRPGRGGRRLSGASFSPSQVIQEVVDELGVEPIWRQARDGGRIAEFLLDPNGDTLGAARLSGRDVQGGETAMGQVGPIIELASRAKLKLRGIIISLNLTGTTLDVADRDDLVLHEAAFKSGCNHVIWRDGDRVAREVVPAEVYYHRLREQRVELWFCCWGRAVNWETDKLALRAMGMVAASECENTTKRLQSAAIIQGPLAGRGWLGPIRFGLMRDDQRFPVPDPEAWPWIHRIYELADVGDLTQPTGEPLSCRDISALLAHGCPIDHDAVRRILRDPIYATGEFICTVKGVRIAQKPVVFSVGCPPIPADRWQRVQDNVTLRAGKGTKTPVGEYLLNSIEAVHRDCECERNQRRQPALIKGWITKPGQKIRRYGHSVFTPKQCRGRRWDREELEHPIIAAVRQLAADPKLQVAWSTAARHRIVDVDVLLGENGRDELGRQIDGLEAECQETESRYFESVGQGTKADVTVFGRLTEGLRKRIAELQSQLDADAARQEAISGRVARPIHKELLAAFLELMSFETPSDPQKRMLRARLLQRCVSKVVFGTDENGALSFDLYGPLVPAEVPFMSFADPVVASEDLLKAYVQANSDEKPAVVADSEIDEVDLNRLVGQAPQVAIDLTVVSRLRQRESTKKRDAKWKASSLESTTWTNRIKAARATGVPCWHGHVRVDSSGRCSISGSERAKSA